MKPIKFHCLNVVYVFALLFSSGAALAAEDGMPDTVMNEQVLNIPGDPDRPVTLQVTVYTPNGPGPFPLAVLNHGAIGEHTSPASQPRYRATYPADYFLSRGYAVVLPMMRGYAGSEGKVEVHGCDLEAAGIDDAKDIRAVISYMATQSNIDASRIVVSGQSFGGWNTLAFGTLHYPNVKGLINFSGGMIAPGCRSSESMLTIAAGHYGTNTNIPSLWFYGDNDKLFAIDTWRTMHDNYNAAGGTAELVAYGKFMENSHIMLNYPEGFRIWVPKIDAFLDKVGLPSKLIHPEYMPIDIPPSTHYAAIDDARAVPHLDEKGQEYYKRFLTKPMPRAFAISKNGVASMQDGGFDALNRSLTQCQQQGKDCQLYAVDNDVVWVRPTSAPPATHFAPLDDKTAVPYLNDAGRAGYVKFLTLKNPRAFAIAPNGSFAGVSDGEDPLVLAIQMCAKQNKGCKLYAVDDAVVWPVNTGK
jgi:dienelactone hydrolase